MTTAPSERRNATGIEPVAGTGNAAPGEPPPAARGSLPPPGAAAGAALPDSSAAASGARPKAVELRISWRLFMDDAPTRTARQWKNSRAARAPLSMSFRFNVRKHPSDVLIDTGYPN
jgi:hypothetical protein